MEVPRIEIKFDQFTGKVSGVDAVWSDGRSFGIKDEEFIRYLSGVDDEDAVSSGTDVDHPKHYNQHPSGIECIEIARHYSFDIGNAIKYLWRHGLKSEKGKTDVSKSIEDLEKAKWYIDDEIRQLKRNL